MTSTIHHQHAMTASLHRLLQSHPHIANGGSFGGLSCYTHPPSQT
jgi:hypothetical protein